MRRTTPLALSVLALALAAGCSGHSTTTTEQASASAGAPTGSAGVPSTDATATSVATSPIPAQPSGSHQPAGSTSPQPGTTATGHATTTGAPGSTASGAPSMAGATALPTPSGALKKYATAQLPDRLGGYVGQVQKVGSTQTGMYTGKQPDLVLLVTLVKGPSVAPSEGGLRNSSVHGHAVCGTQAGSAACVIPLDGGYVHLQGSSTGSVDELAKVANQLWAALA